jgi:hypothetical protein
MANAQFKKQDKLRIPACRQAGNIEH